MINKATQQFADKHANADVRLLALLTHQADGVDLAAALNQIAGRQAARKKLPSWAATDGIVYPQHLAIEQSSGEQAARYKALLLKRILSSPSSFTQNPRLIDLTGGLGADFAFMSQALGNTQATHTYVERNPQLCQTAQHNSTVLGLKNVEVVCSEAEDYILQLQQTAPPDGELSIFYLDPARRDTNGRRTYAIADCSPNILNIMETLAGSPNLHRSSLLIVKLSPMLDWHEAVRQLTDPGLFSPVEVHIVAVANECKELLVVLSPSPTDTQHPSPAIHCVNDNQHFTFTLHPSSVVPQPSPFKQKPSLLLVPNAAIMKAGCFSQLCEQFPVAAASPNSHLFLPTTDTFQADTFPGRAFSIIETSSMNKHELRSKLQGIEQANIAVRNFPMKADELRRRLKLRDGGDTYIFATTITPPSPLISRPSSSPLHLLFICKKA